MNFDDLELANQRVCPPHRHGKQLEMTTFSHHILCLSFNSHALHALYGKDRFKLAKLTALIMQGAGGSHPGRQLTAVDNVELPRACLWTLVGSRCTQKEPTKKDFGYRSNPRKPSC